MFFVMLDGMIVYIEYVILDNLFMNVLICFVTYKILRAKVDYFQTIIVSSLGSVFAIMLPLIHIPNFFLVVVKLWIGLMLGYILSFHLPKKIYGILIFFISTFLMGGIVLSINYIQYGDIDSAINKPLTPIPLWLCILILLFFGIIIVRLIGLFHQKTDTTNFERDVEIFINDNSIKLNGLVDSGNRLYYFDQPLSIINYHKIKHILDKNTIDAIQQINNTNPIHSSTQQQEQNKKNIRFVELETLNGVNKIIVIKSQKIVLYSKQKMNIFYEMMLGISTTTIQDYDILLPPAVLAN